MIRTIDLHNFKCFTDLSIRLSNLNIFAGSNGAGKSTILQALLMLRQSYAPDAPAQSNLIRLNNRLIQLISIEKVRNRVAKDYTISIVIDDTELAEDFTVTIPNAGTASSEPEAVYSDNRPEAIAKMALFAKDFAYLYANRISPEVEYTRTSAEYTDSRLGDRSGSRTAFCLQDALDNNTSLDLENLDLSGKCDVATNVSAWISHIIGSPLKVKPDAIDERRVKLMFTPGADGEETDATNMAFGDTYILPIIVGVLTAPKGSMLIIENPEAHLHPRAQRQMGRFLAMAAEGGVQILIETHSDHLLNGVRLAAKKKLVDADNVRIHFIDEEKTDNDLNSEETEHVAREITLRQNGTLENWPDGFFDEWENALRDILDEE